MFKRGNGLRIVKLTSILMLLSSCLDPSSSVSSSGLSSSTVNWSNYSQGDGVVIQTNPIAQYGWDISVDENTNMNKFLASEPVFITNQTQLISPCLLGEDGAINPCIIVTGADDTDGITSESSRWAFDASSDSFLQVQTFYHVRKIISRFHEIIADNFPLAVSNYNHWYEGEILKVYAKCDYADNSYFDPAVFAVCMGYTSDETWHRWAQDPSVIYHEVGHLLSHIMLNLNNSTYKTSFGVRAPADEASGVGEGISDWFAYYMNGRTHFGEWATGLFYNASRPLTEDDDLHAPGIDSSIENRLSYPKYLGYFPQEPTKEYEDNHSSGMIISHFLRRLTQELQDECSLDFEDAGDFVLKNMATALSEIGKRDDKLGTLGPYYYEPIDFRNFPMKFAKEVMLNLPSSCPSTYSRESIEELLDSYGLLLFKTYNDSPDLLTYPELRIKSALILKEHVTTPSTSESQASVYVIDSMVGINNLLQDMSLYGELYDTDTSPADVTYNNGNGTIGRGEVIGIGLNLYNASNATAAGVRVLANNFAHVDKVAEKTIPDDNGSGGNAICKIDGYPTTDQGGVDCVEEDLLTDDNSMASSPCFIEYTFDNRTRYLTQSQYMSLVGDDESYCLNEDKENCYVSFLDNIDSAHFSKIDPQSTWGESFDHTVDSVSFNSGNILLMKINPSLSPGTKIMCRFRVTFTNCDDCNHNSQDNDRDFTLKERQGWTPYNVLNYSFSIMD